LLKLIMPDVRAKHRSRHRRCFIYESIDVAAKSIDVRRDVAPTVCVDER